MGGLFIAVSAGDYWLAAICQHHLFAFFEIPTPQVSVGSPASWSPPAHGTCGLRGAGKRKHTLFLDVHAHRISIFFISLRTCTFKNAPVAGKNCSRHPPARAIFSAPSERESAQFNENVSDLGSPAASGERVAVRQIAGVIARRIITWVQPGDFDGAWASGLGLIQFGSRCGRFILPLNWQIAVKTRGQGAWAVKTIIGPHLKIPIDCISIREHVFHG